MNVYASAPGKVVLCGEYVVLDGALAIGLALNKRASAAIAQGESSSDIHLVRCPGLADSTYTFRVSDDFEFEWQSNLNPNLTLLECVWKSMTFRPSGSLRLFLDTRALFDIESGRKMGIGSSAAMTVALSAAIATLQGKAIGLDDTIHLHRLFQDGRGSGIDIAVSKVGGVVEFGGGSNTTVSRKVWPEGLNYAILWSGTVASTEDKLTVFGAQKNSRSREQLAAASGAIVSNWSQLDAPSIVGLVSEYTSLLQTFSEEHRLGIFDAGHSDMSAEAARLNVAYKPCGAGGGDVGIVLSEDKDAMSNFIKVATRKGFHLLDVRIDDIGLLIDEQKT